MVILISSIVVSRSPLNFSTVILTCVIVSLACASRSAIENGSRPAMVPPSGTSGACALPVAMLTKMPPTSPSVWAEAIESVRTSGVEVVPDFHLHAELALG